MKKIFAFIGSPHGSSSNTYNLTMMFINALREMDSAIELDICTAGNVKINPCRGCWQCMTRGNCPEDDKDDLGRLRQKMLEADFIIWGSPVYTYSVSGQMKTFLDRLASWYHCIMLAGKPGMTVSTTAGNGLEQVHNLLGCLLEALGVIVVAKLDAYGYFPNTLQNPEEARKNAIAAAKEAYPYISGEKKPAPSVEMEEIFQLMKRKTIDGRQWLPSDYEYWQKNGMLEVNSFSELLSGARCRVK